MPSEAGFGGRSSDRLAKINERPKLGKPGRALNGDLWVSAGGGAGRRGVVRSTELWMGMVAI